MLTLTPINAAILWLPGPLKPHSLVQKPVKPRLLCCLRTNEEIGGLFRATAELEGHENADLSKDNFLPPNTLPEAKQNDIWQLFTEAQKNILYLNKHRLMAIEELKQLNKEKQLLLDRIDQLEAEKEKEARKDKVTMFWELLLRIDAMVLTGLINKEEAYDLRRQALYKKNSIADVSPDILMKKDADILSELHQYFSDRSKRNAFHIVHVCTEMAPLVSVGSLASYVTGLSRALQRKGHLVEVILPKYTSLELEEIQGLHEIDAEAYSYFNGQLHGNRIWTGVVYGIGVTLIQPLYYSSFFNREKIYGYLDDFERFSYFSRASMDYLVKSGKQPDVIHIHNWETAIVGPLFWDIFVKQGLESSRVLLTCQGFDSQCLVQPDKLALCGLDPSRLHRSDRLQDNAKTNLVNILKGGIIYSNKVVTLTSMHSKGMIIHSFTHGLESTLAIHKEKLVIAPFGFENSIWDPSKDKFLPENYSAEDMKGKSVCKVALQKWLGLVQNASTIIAHYIQLRRNVKEGFLHAFSFEKEKVGFIFSEVSDVELENLKATVQDTTGRSVQFVFMGISKMPDMNEALVSIQEELKEGNIFISNYDEALSHLLLAGSDILFCRSFHDLIFQAPLKALKYGAAPVLVAPSDDIFRHFVDHDQETTRFSQFICSAFGNISLNQALDQIENNPSTWTRKVTDAMARDFSWDAECSDIHVSAYTSIKGL